MRMAVHIGRCVQPFGFVQASGVGLTDCEQNNFQRNVPTQNTAKWLGRVVNGGNKCFSVIGLFAVFVMN